MHPMAPRPLAVVHGSLPLSLADYVDEAFDLYFEWRKEAAEAASAFRRWAEAAAGEMARAFVGYHAAIDQEEAAASSYAHAAGELERAARRLGLDPAPLVSPIRVLS
jgi:hypothetical protein